MSPHPLPLSFSFSVFVPPPCLFFMQKIWLRAASEPRGTFTSPLAEKRAASFSRQSGDSTRSPPGRVSFALLFAETDVGKSHFPTCP